MDFGGEMLIWLNIGRWVCGFGSVRLGAEVEV